MAIEKDLLEYYRAGVQKVVDSGQYGNTFYIFEYDGKLMSTNNKNGGVGKLVETVTAAKPSAEEEAEHGFGEHEPADYCVQYEGTGKL